MHFGWFSTLATKSDSKAWFPFVCKIKSKALFEKKLPCSWYLNKLNSQEQIQIQH